MLPPKTSHRAEFHRDQTSLEKGGHLGLGQKNYFVTDRQKCDHLSRNLQCARGTTKNGLLNMHVSKNLFIRHHFHYWLIIVQIHNIIIIIIITTTTTTIEKHLTQTTAKKLNADNIHIAIYCYDSEILNAEGANSNFRHLLSLEQHADGCVDLQVMISY